MVVQKLTYTPIDDKFDSDIFTINKSNYNFENAKEVKKHIYNYLITDSKTEKQFADELDSSEEVVVYAKLPKSFFIPTPVGNYSPDWAIAFKEGSVQYIYFVAETKASMSSLQIRKIEEIKIKCAEKFFDKLSGDNLKFKYSKIDNYNKLWNIVNGK
ncbi:hypothetical protein NG769_05705 [Aliarcobacter cryaerophilus]|uniref:restriction endonuclease n=1 Tax=Aliarcobacter cryaerophilus TaxID=28198 RepID=UPI003DA29781